MSPTSLPRWPLRPISIILHAIPGTHLEHPPAPCTCAACPICSPQRALLFALTDRLERQQAQLEAQDVTP